MNFLDVNSFLSPRGGGARTYHIKKAEWFVSHPEHRYMVMGPGAGRGELSLCADCPPIRTGYGIPYGTLKNYRVLVDPWELSRLVRSESPQVVEIGDPWLSARWSKRLPKSVLRTAFWHSDPHTAYLEPWARNGRAWRKLASRQVLSIVDSWHRHFDLIWCASDWVADHLRSRGYPNVETIRFGIDKSQFHARAKSPEVLRKFGLDPDRPVLLYAGRLDIEKGVSVLEEAIPRILSLDSRPQVMVTGRGEWEPRFRALQMEGYVYGGFLEDREELANLVSSADLLLATCAVETFGLSVLEGLCSGTGVVSADGGGGGEQVRTSGAGELFASGSATEFVKAVERALPKASELSAKARAWGEAWPTWNEMFTQQIGRCMEIRDARH
ncbi:MAG: hypothetical protein RL173_1765 [Fibrobacterota bacterium]|jgi:alpha-1,6-mannosyltransferase